MKKFLEKYLWVSVVLLIAAVFIFRQGWFGAPKVVAFRQIWSNHPFLVVGLALLLVLAIALQFLFKFRHAVFFEVGWVVLVFICLGALVLKNDRTSNSPKQSTVSKERAQHIKDSIQAHAMKDGEESVVITTPPPAPTVPTTGTPSVTVPDQSQVVADEIKSLKEELKQEFKEQLQAAKDSIITAVKKQQVVVKKQITVVRPKKKRSFQYDKGSTATGNPDEYIRADGKKMKVIL